MNKERQYIRFDLVKRKSKTNVYSVININHNYRLGEIKWYSGWRRYCFHTEDEEIILSSGCMNQIIEFIERLKKEQKKGLHGKQ